MNIGRLISFTFALLILISNAHATSFNGYIVKLKKNFSTPIKNNQSFFSLRKIAKIVETNFGTFLQLETNLDLNTLALKSILKNSEVDYIEPNYILSLNQVALPSDPIFNKQWGLNNVTRPKEDINALLAWGITKGSKSIKIAVVDTGVDYTHPDLLSQMDVNTAELNGISGIDDDGNGFIDDIYGYNFVLKNGDPQDGNGHGTHCAGIIGAAHNSIGVAGVMAEVKIVALKFLSDNGSGETIDAVAAIDYAIKRGVNVMSNSWGGGEKDQSLEEAIKAADKAGIIFVTAAGNESSDNDVVASYPANYKVPNIISVASFTIMGSKSSFSNFGINSVHVTAPGTAIFSTYKKGGYSSLSGTSVAAPFVAGIVGLMLSKNAHLSPSQIKEKLIKTSIQTSKLVNVSLSKGRVDAYKALLD